MRDVYSNNTNLGDPASIDAKLAENATATHNLEAEQTKFKVAFCLSFYVFVSVCL